jgi:hypothetical protein
MKNTLLSLCLFLCTFLYAQKERSAKMGQTNLEELQMTYYDKDSSANALVLYEQGNYYRSKLNNFRFTTDYYHRVKIFNREGVKNATITIYTSNKKNEIVSDIKAISYNINGKQLIETTSLNDEQIYKSDITEKFTKTTFTLPNVKPGTVIEYSYSISSYSIQIRDWYFQSHIPKLMSEFDLAILGNYKYNVRFLGPQSLGKEDSFINKSCIEMPGGQIAPCAAYYYGMKDIPGFKSEDYMLSKQNYLSRIIFDLESVSELVKYTIGGKGEIIKDKVTNYTKTWKDADKTLKNDFLNYQSSKEKYFKKKIPSDIFNEINQMTKAKKIYSFIQNHYTWNEKNWISSDIKLKESFDRKVGSVDEINLSLYNSLQAADIESYITLVTTRDRKQPTTLFPALNDFNYIIVKVVINGNDYFLDATDIYLPFGTVPFRCLNGVARVFDFKKGSYWQPIPPNNKNNSSISSTILMNTDGNIEVTSNVVSSGYFANEIRHKYNLSGEEDYKNDIEIKLVDFEIEDYLIKYNSNLEKPINESFTLLSDDDFSTQNKISLKPFLISRVSSNPFKLKERLYPVDFGYKRSVTQRINIEVPEGYEVTSLPDETVIKLPNNGGSFVYKIQHANNTIKIYSKLLISKKIYNPEEYNNLKDFFKQIIFAENAVIVFEKI